MILLLYIQTLSRVNHTLVLVGFLSAHFFSLIERSLVVGIYTIKNPIPP